MADPEDVGPGGSTFTHLDEAGSARMVDVGAKEPTRRRAVARARIEMSPETAAALVGGSVPKGDVLAVARVAGIQAAKRTSELVPLCHPLMLSSVSVDLEVEESHVAVEATVETVERTGVEMEALTACSVAALTVYDMCKALDRAMVITDVALWEKDGGRSGSWRRAT
ncbi:MAG: cyclic pyranopterin monophosphate synthase MoaC [Acidimicrobiaceae bacterium]|jgi:cyclic pyranopterin phosphate synthase|nr:cyclic pyranopterin monophosphate synthase MoaC [Acidimicrobiaceae bacterium]|tara:strand:+ start:918 stop:1421 length:504 start_codon:yes stop_codon:yes gene_type:complete